MTMAIPKQKPVRSRKLRESARGQECAMRLPGICNGDPDTVVLAHPPVANGGMATKASDDCGVFACSECHDALDGRNRGMPREEIQEGYIRGHIETLERWHQMGLVKVEGSNES